MFPKAFTRFLVIAVALGACLALAIGILFPLVYSVKEPYFIMPVPHGKSAAGAPGLTELPIRNDDYGEGHFGAKRRNNRLHKGIDLAAEMKSPAFASKSGWASVYSIPRGYGNLVIIKHPGAWQTRYGHLDEIKVKDGQWVRQGAIIGTVGKTGNANTAGIIPHLHFEIRRGGEAVDPAPFLLKQKR